MSEMLSLQPAAPPRRSWGVLKIFVVLIVLMVVAFLWFMFSRLENRASLTVNLIPVSTPISTSLTEVLVTPNQHVQKGQPLVKIDLTGYAEQLPHASALVRGAFSGDIGSRVADAANMEADMVRRTALARHEENTLRQAVEHHSTEHARTLVKLRAMPQSNSQAYRNAVHAELNTRQKLQRAKANFELASRQRVAIEGELYKIRDERARNPAYIPTGNAGLGQEAGSNIVAEHIVANVNGFLVGDIPKAGISLAKDTVLFNILPEKGANFTLRLNMSADKAAHLRKNGIVYLVLEHGIVHGNIEDIQPQGDASFVLRISGTEPNMIERLQSYIVGENKEQGQADANAAPNIQASNLVNGQAIPIRMVFWPENVLTQQFAHLYTLMIPLLNAWGNMSE